MKTIIVLDAMGVIYRACDDVAELLIPFVKERNENAEDENIKEAYIDCSLGKISASEFWEKFGLTEKIEDEYLLHHHLTDGFIEWLIVFSQRFKIICLSNDVSRWSMKLRKRFGLEEFIKDWHISGNIGFRKPDEEIFEAVENKHGKTNRYLFLDDNPKNVKKAKEMGWESYLFTKNRIIEENEIELESISSFKEIEKIIGKIQTLSN